jgi:hypothetical protein
MSSAELDFALVLARVIGSIENDPAQLRNAVYELARIKLQREAWQQHPPMSGRESRRMMLALEAAIDRVETMSSRYNELRAPQLLDRLIESSGFLPQHPISIEHNPVLTIEQDERPDPSVDLSSATHVPRNRARHRPWSAIAALLAAALVAAGGLAAYVILDRQFGSFDSRSTSPVEAVVPASQKDDAAPSPTIRSQLAGLPLPVAYGVYAISDRQSNELEPLPIRVPDPRVFMSAVIKRPSRTHLPDGRVVFIVFRRDIAASAPDRVAVRIIAKIARTMTFNPTTTITPVDDEWAIRGTSHGLRVEPVKENPEMLILRPEDPNFVFPPGRYALAFKGQAFDFTVAGVITEAANCLERTEAANGTFYSECQNP